MINLEITDPSLVLQIILHLASRLEREPALVEDLLRAGASPELISVLRGEVHLDVLRRVAEQPTPRISARIDSDGLMEDIGRRRRFQADERIKRQLCVAGASTELLVRWFPMSREDAKALRSGISPSLGGRPKLPEVSQRNAIHAVWATLSELPEREAYLVLHRKFPQHTVTSLWHVVHEHDSATRASDHRRRGAASVGLDPV